MSNFVQIVLIMLALSSMIIYTVIYLYKNYKKQLNKKELNKKELNNKLKENDELYMAMVESINKLIYMCKDYKVIYRFLLEHEKNIEYVFDSSSGKLYFREVFNVGNDLIEVLNERIWYKCDRSFWVKFLNVNLKNLIARIEIDLKEQEEAIKTVNNICELNHKHTRDIK